MPAPSKFNPEVTPVIAAALARRGFTDDQIAAALDPPVGARTFQEWKKKHPGFADIIHEAKHLPDIIAEDSLFKRVRGFETTETHVEVKDGSRKVKKVTRNVAPDVTACIFWLKNRRPDIWKDVRRSEITGPDGAPIRIEDMTLDDERRLISETERFLAAIAAESPDKG